MNLREGDAGRAQRVGEVVQPVAAGGDRLYDLTDALRSAGVTLSEVHTVRPDLEDVFLERTGASGGESP